MFVHAIFARFGRQNRVFGRNGTEREKRRDWLAERIGFELAVAFRHSFALLWPEKRGFWQNAQTENRKPEKVGGLHADRMRFELVVRFVPF
jgi:hypothetical protein